MSNTPKIGLEELSPTTANQATIVNIGGYAILDQLVDRTVKSRSVSTPPGSPADGDAYIVGSSPTGAWAGKANQVAYWRNSTGAWKFIVPKGGWIIRVQDELDANGIPKEYGFTGSAWAVPVVAASWTGGTVTTGINEAPIVTLASAATVNIGAAASNTVIVTGTTTITAFDSIASGATRRIVFNGVLTLTHNSSSLILPTAANLTTAAGDVFEFVSLGSGNWRCIGYQKANGQALTGSIQSIPIACSDEVTALVAGISKVTFRMPYGLTLTGVRASLTTAQTSGSIFTVDVNEAGVSILSTKLTIDNTKKSSVTSTTQPVISDSSLADDAEITIDIDQIGDGTATGLKVYLIGVRT